MILFITLDFFSFFSSFSSSFFFFGYGVLGCFYLAGNGLG